MVNSQKFCLNCGHESHCGEKCLQDYGESEKTVCLDKKRNNPNAASANKCARVARAAFSKRR